MTEFFNTKEFLNTPRGPLPTDRLERMRMLGAQDAHESGSCIKGAMYDEAEALESMSELYDDTPTEADKAAYTEGWNDFMDGEEEE